MELIVYSILALVAYLVLKWLFNGIRWLSGSRYRAFHALARLYHGRCETQQLGDRPTVRFPIPGAEVRVGLAPDVPGRPQMPPRTRVIARFENGVPLRLELASFERPAPPQPPKSTSIHDLKTPRLQGRFRVYSNDREMTDALLNEMTAVHIERLVTRSPRGGFVLSLTPERLLVQIDRSLATETAILMEVVNHSLALADELMRLVADQVSAGILILEEPHRESVEPVGSPTCLVCSEPIVGRAAMCCRCQTPHHPDCWSFVGACSVFGCKHREHAIVRYDSM